MKIAPSTFLLVLALSLPAIALDIQIVAGPGLAGNVPALAAWQRAAVQWESRFSDPIVVKIDADMATLGPGIIGSAGSELVFGDTYQEIRDLIVADAADEPLNAIVSSLPATIAGLNVNLSAGRSLENSLIVTKANLKALNPNTTGWSVSLLDYVFNAPDANITFSNSFNFDYDNSNGVGPGLVDFETVAAHEIGHALGFISEVDTIDSTTAAEYPQIRLTSLDLFRFATGSAPNNAATFGTAAREMRPGQASLFSDTAMTGAMSTGIAGGDGRQASHWKDDGITFNNLGIMDPTLANGTIMPITALDIRAFDLIGWDAVPEPSTTALGLLGFAACLRRRRSPSAR